MSSSDSIEVTASTIDEAISQALAQLGAEQDDVAIEVLSAPRAGVLGLGARPARVRVTRHAPAVARSGVMSPPPAPPLKPTPPQSAQRPAPRPTPPQRPAAPPPPVKMDEVHAGGIEAAGEEAPHPDVEVSREPRREDRREPRRRDRREVPERGARPGPAPQRAREPDDNEVTQPGELDYVREPDIADADAEAAAGMREQARAAREILSELLRMMGERAEIELAESDDPDMLELNIRGDGSGLLIGRHGQTLDAIEYLVNRMLARRIKDAAPISVDTESYRARRRRQLQRMALAKGEQAKREHVAVTLEPMPPRDRRIVHLALKDDPMIATRSSGEGFMRAVEIVPADARRGAPPGDSSRRERRGEGEREPLGQQGGFKHGQKRIV